MTQTSTKYFTETEATDEAMLLLFRKVRRTASPDAFEKIWTALPEGARRAIYAAESRADLVRVRTDKTWEPEPEFDADLTEE